MLPVDVTTSRERIQENTVNVLNGGLQVPLDDTVELERLSRSDLESTRTVLVRNLIHAKPLL